MTLLEFLGKRVDGIHTLVGPRFSISPAGELEVWGRNEMDDGFKSIRNGVKFRATSLSEGVRAALSADLWPEAEAKSELLDRLESVAREKGIRFGSFFKNIFGKATILMFLSLESKKPDASGVGGDYQEAVNDCLEKLNSLS